MCLNEQQKELVKNYFQPSNTFNIVKQLFGAKLTPKQTEIVRKIGFAEEKRLSICAMTRYGKTFCTALGVAIYILLHPGKRIALIAPQKEQAEILRNYLTELILSCPLLMEITEFDVKGAERLKKEVSKNRMTFKNGCEYKIYSAYHDAYRLMGAGADLVLVDEACLVSDEAYAKIMRMLGDNPEQAVLIELFNPWNRDNKAYEHSNDPAYCCLHIGWRDALKEGRITKSFLEEQRKELTPLEFEVLYESRFPAQSEDSVFNLDRVKEAGEKQFNLVKGLPELLDLVDNPSKHTESEVKKAREELKAWKAIIAADVADKGLDHTVVFWGYEKEGQFEVVGRYSEPYSENMAVAGRINNLVRSFIGRHVKGLVNIDCTGVGTGVVSRVKEVVRDEGFVNVTVKGAHFGESPINKKRFLNRKAENYFRLRSLFIEGNIAVKGTKELSRDAGGVKWELTSGGDKVRIVDPDKSPDETDALVFFVWRDARDAVVAFV